MAQPPLKHPVSPATPILGAASPNVGPNAQFTPRKEFIPDRRVTSSFSLLTLSGPGLVRLYSFPQPGVAALRRFFDQRNLITAVREDAPKHFFEFALDGKPWANPKSIKAEKLIVDILAVVLSSGYNFLSSIDYGREQDDRIAISFSKPRAIVPPNIPIGLLSNASAVSLNQPLRIPFALSFSSTTTIRVVGPPLHSTPAILQAVRVAWPRGVVSEKKVGDATYEFKLKGYKWFQEDSFATDSLRHILGLLETLDHHGFTLLASFSLSGRSRVKDLWIFTGLADDQHPDTPIPTPNTSSLDLKREVTPQTHAANVVSPSPLFQSETLGPHGARKLPNPPGPSPLGNGHTHIRSASDSTPFLSFKPITFGKGSSTLLRKPPKTTVQVPVAYVPEYPLDQSLFPNVSPDKSPSVGSVDMTGVGTGLTVLRRSIETPQRTPDLFYSPDGRANGFGPQVDRTMFPIMSHSSPYPLFVPTARDRRASSDSRPAPSPQDTSRHRARSSESRPPNRISSLFSVAGQTPGVSSSLSPESSQAQTSMKRQASGQEGNPPASDVQHYIQREGEGSYPEKSAEPKPLEAPPRIPTPPLLPPGVFRDSAFSTSTVLRQSYDVPIHWTGKHPEPTSGNRMHNGHAEREEERRGQPHSTRHEHDRASAGPLPPGGWTSTPREERNDVSTMFPPTIREQPSQEHEEGGFLGNAADVTLNRQEGSVPSRSPEHVHPHLHGVRKSEAASVGVVLGGKHPHPKGSKNPGPSNRDGEKEKEKEKTRPPLANARKDTVAAGWVMVNVEGHGKSKESKGAGAGPNPPNGTTPKIGKSKKSAGPQQMDHARGASDSRVPTRGQLAQNGGAAPSSMSPAAKAIAIIDAQGAKEHKEHHGVGSGLKRLLSRGKGAANGRGAPNGESKGTPQRRNADTTDSKKGEPAATNEAKKKGKRREKRTDVER